LAWLTQLHFIYLIIRKDKLNNIKIKVMKNGNNQIFNVKKSFAIADQVVVMEGDQLKYLSTDTVNDESVDIYFEVINSFWCEGIEINLTPKQVVEYLTYDKVYR